jgi:hypothetical protein
VNVLWLLPLTGEHKPSVFLSGESGTYPTEARFSPDGRWLAYVEYGSGKREVYITPFPGKTGKWQVSAAGVDLSGSTPRTGTPKELFDLHLVYSPVSPEWGAYDAAADGKRFLVDSMDETPAPEPINLIVNWDVQLKK